MTAESVNSIKQMEYYQFIIFYSQKKPQDKIIFIRAEPNLIAHVNLARF